jgi:hypothetical protein
MAEGRRGARKGTRQAGSAAAAASPVHTLPASRWRMSYHRVRERLRGDRGLWGGEEAED